MAARYDSGGASAPPIVLPPILAFMLGVPVAPRSSVEAVIERMIDALDALDGDPAVEPLPDWRGVDPRYRAELRDADAILAIEGVGEDDPPEPNGDEEDGTLGEDDFCFHSPACEMGAAGCPISDPDCAVDDKPCDEFTEDGV